MIIVWVVGAVKRKPTCAHYETATRFVAGVIAGKKNVLITKQRPKD